MIQHSRHRMVWSGLDLNADHPESYSLRVLADGADFGNAEPVDKVIRTLLGDGEVVRRDRANNRTARLAIQVTAPDSIALAAAEEALGLRDGKPGDLLWEPPDGLTASVFDLQTAHLAFSLDDMGELQLRRVYVVEFVALPYVRTVNPVTVESLPAGSSASVTTIDACDALTGWDAGTRSLTLGTSSPDSGTGYLYSSAALSAIQLEPIPGGTRVIYQAPLMKDFAPISFASTPYLVLRTRGSLGPVALKVTVNPDGWTSGGRAAEHVASELQPNGWTAHWFYVPVATVTRIRINTIQSRDYTGGAPLPSGAGIGVDTIQRSTQADLAGTGRAQLRSIPIQGAYRTPGSLRLTHPTSSLGEVILVTCRDLANGWRPDLRRSRSSGATPTADAGTVSGFRELVDNTVFTIPARTLRPGGWVLMARMRRSASSTPSTLTATARLRVGTTDLGPAETLTTRAPFPTSGWSIHILGRLHLPPAAVAAESTAAVRLSINAAGTTPEWDEMWLVPSDAEVTVLNGVSSGSPSLENARFSALRLDAPTVQQPRGGAWVGTEPDWSDALSASPWLERLGRHELAPSETLIYAVTAGAVGASLSAEYFPLAHSNSAGAPGAA